MIKKALIEINQNCNLNCDYCFYNDYVRKKESLKLNDIENLFNQYKHLKQFYLTGGECLLATEIDNIIDFLSAKGSVVIFTNSINLTNKSKDYLKWFIEKIKRVIITFDSFNYAYKARGDSSDIVLDNIGELLELNSDKVEVKVCLSKININDFEKTINRLRELGVKKMSLNFIHNIENSNLKYEITDEEDLKNVFEIIDYNIDLFNYYDIEDFKNFFLKRENRIIDKCICGNSMVFIDCTGKIYDCPARLVEFNEKYNSNQEAKVFCLSKECINLWEVFNDM